MASVIDEPVKGALYTCKNKKANFLKPWWTHDIGILYAAKKEALRPYNRNKSEVNYIRLQKLVRKIKRGYVRELTEKIDTCSTTAHVCIVDVTTIAKVSIHKLISNTCSYF